MLSTAILPALVPSWGCSHASTGMEPKVHALRFEGNTAVSDGALRAQLVTEATAWYPFAATKRLDIAALDQDMRRITAFYADRGYFDARIAHRRIEPRQDGAVDITVTIDEGPPTKISSVSWGAGGAGGSVDETRWTKLAQSASVSPDAPADYAHYDTTKAQ